MFKRLSERPLRLHLDNVSQWPKTDDRQGPEPVDLASSSFCREFPDYIRNIMLILEQSPTGKALLGRAVANGLSVGLDPLLEPQNCFFYAEQNHFDLGYQPDLLQMTEKGISRYLACFVGALRKSWHNTGDFNPIWRHKPEEALRAWRCMEADSEAVLHLVAWELRAAGAGFFWRALLSGDNGDISFVFERIASEGPEHQFNGKACRAAFEQWFADRARVAAADHQALEIIDMLLLERFPKTFSGQSMKRSQLQALGFLPGGKNYLAGCLFTGAHYENLDDPFNQVHLQQICRDLAREPDRFRL